MAPASWTAASVQPADSASAMSSSPGALAAAHVREQQQIHPRVDRHAVGPDLLDHEHGPPVSAPRRKIARAGSSAQSWMIAVSR